MRDVNLRIDSMKYSIRFNDRTAFELHYCRFYFVQLHCDAKFQPVVHCEYIDQSQCEKQTVRNQMRKCYRREKREKRLCTSFPFKTILITPFLTIAIHSAARDH